MSIKMTEKQAIQKIKEMYTRLKETEESLKSEEYEGCTPETKAAMEFTWMGFLRDDLSSLQNIVSAYQVFFKNEPEIDEVIKGANAIIKEYFPTEYKKNLDIINEALKRR